MIRDDAKAGVKALFDSGLFGTATAGDKEIKVALPEVKKGDKADSVSVKDVHVCCGKCVGAIKGLLCFFNEKVDLEFDGELEARPETAWSPGHSGGVRPEAARH